MYVLSMTEEKRLEIRINKKLLDRLDNYCIKEDKIRSRLIKRIIKEYLDKVL